jgi:hypothetical protein
MLATETDIVLPAASLQQLRSELSALITATAQTAWSAASQFAVHTAGKSEAREASPCGYASERRPAMRHGEKVPSPPAQFSNPAVAPLSRLDVGRFRRELDALRSYMNHTAFHRHPDNGSAPQHNVDDGGTTASSLQQRVAAGQPSFVHDAVTSAVRLLERRAISPDR